MGKQKLSEATTDTGKNMSKESTSDAAADNDLNLQTDNEFLQLDVEQEKIDMLYAEAMEDLFESPKTERNPRDGLNPLTPEPTLPELGPGDIKIIVEAPKEPNTATEEIINNKTVRVNGEEQPSRTPNDDKVCCGCAAIGHVLVS